ncbi:hypothetical protein HanIR_Chr15g0772771 [Helianthus annuus]|nr:hypothetical protein HanIR_Chr15g0772771 [Helianthus annuus]
MHINTFQLSSHISLNFSSFLQNEKFQSCNFIHYYHNMHCSSTFSWKISHGYMHPRWIRALGLCSSQTRPYPPSLQQPITALSTSVAMARNDSVAGYSEKWTTLEAILTHGRRNKHHMVCLTN